MHAFARHFSSFFIAVTLATAACIAHAKDAKPVEAKLPVITLVAGGQSIKAEVAAKEEHRQKGLMFRTQMGKSDGMLFVFPQLGYHAMWMRNTLIPLSVAYMDESGKILSIHEMEPQNDTAHQSPGPARYALEMNTKWFSQHKVNVGDTIKGLEKAPKPE
jgi:uncharacterized protein